jgi:hypothetical protein
MIQLVCLELAYFLLHSREVTPNSIDNLVRDAVGSYAGSSLPHPYALRDALPRYDALAQAVVATGSTNNFSTLKPALIDLRTVCKYA